MAPLAGHDFRAANPPRIDYGSDRARRARSLGRRFAGLLGFSLMIAGTLDAHDSRPILIEIIGMVEDNYSIRLKAPASLPPGNLPEVLLPERCEPAGEEVIGGGGLASYVRLRQVRCQGGLAEQALRIRYPILNPSLTTLMRMQTVSGVTITSLLTPEETEWIVPAEPTRLGVARDYALLGIRHILEGVDHLLFVLGLLLLVRGRWRLLKTITAFTVAHSITLATATLGYASAPLEPLNAAIALSILFLGPEILRSCRGGTSMTIRHPWVVAFAFGLLHGFGFASGLRATGLPTGEVAVSLLFFNIGVEAGQVGCVLVVVLLERSFRALEVNWPRWAEAAPGYAVGSLGAFWTIERIWVMIGSRLT